MNLAHHRLYHQQIAHPHFTNPVTALACLGAIQGQDYPGAKWSLGLRAPGTTDAQIEQLIADKQIVRTWAMRGTLHLMAAADIRWMVDLVGSRIIARTQRRYKQLELDAETLRRSNDILVNALAGGQSLDRKELFAILESKGISTQGQRGYYMLFHASLSGLIFQGVIRNNQPTVMQTDAALSTAKTLPREEALAELARRYFTSRGPTTVADFVHWSSLKVADAKAGLAAIKSQLVQETIGDEAYWLSPENIPEQPPAAYALPGFDEYILGYKNRNAVLNPQYAQKICPGKNGVFYPTIVIDGQVVGTWKRAFKRGSILINLSPFENLSSHQKAAFSDAIQRFGEFHQMPVVLE